MLQTLARSTIKHMPVGLGFAAVRALAARPTRAPVSDEEATAMAAARQLTSLGWSGDAAWSWGTGPNIVLVHGWGGRAAQMAPLAAYLAGLGYRTHVFDMAGHGLSKQPEASWAFMIRDVGTFTRAIGGAAAMIGHSAGGLAMMASRCVTGLQAEKYVCICAPSHPYPPIRGITQRLDPGDAVLERYKQFLAEQFQSSWSKLEAGHSFEGAGRDLLLCYDEKDRFIAHTEGDRLKSLCPGSQLVTTRTFGHTRILVAAETKSTVGQFLGPPGSAS